jgi:hypothetical protein
MLPDQVTFGLGPEVSVLRATSSACMTSVKARRSHPRDLLLDPMLVVFTASVKFGSPDGHSTTNPDDAVQAAVNCHLLPRCGTFPHSADSRPLLGLAKKCMNQL